VRSAVRRVMSHPLALAQCADFFRTNRGLEAVSVFDTAGAVRLAVEGGDGQTAAIASRRAASLYGAEIIGEHIQDHLENWTRFLMVSSPSQETQVEAPQKALVAFGLKHEPGALWRALKPLAEHGLSVTKIEGRPLPGRQFEYRFLVEMVAADGGTIGLDAIQSLRDATTWLKVLGAFRL
jgi:prephenate dehydratase